MDISKEVYDLIMNQGEKYGVSIYDDYSGRFMYGKTTTGIVVDNVSELALMIEESDLDFRDQTEFLCEVLRSRKDDLGKSTIYY